ncbi:MAG: tRNA lysidine(34) synthetase TilS [Nitriliruptoraceae bacterium]|nr:tRNA lysidine(34) synthetase TilS [Nitriliruptoraceae bacterium]
MVVVACSAGADSTALAALLDEARADLDLRLVHVDHGIRSTEERAADHLAVTTLASWLGRPVEVVTLDLGADGVNEERARDARHAALEGVATDLAAVAIAYGHTAEDQAETVLLRLARGTGTTGAGGMSSWLPTDRGFARWRPLLRLRRADVHRFVEGEGLPTHRDHTNDDDTVRRIRARTELLPALGRLADDPVGALGRFADLATDDAVTLDRLAATSPAAALQRGTVVLVEQRAVGRLEPAIGRRVVRDALIAVTGQVPDAATTARVLGTRGPAARTLSGGIRLRADHGWWALERLPSEDRAGALDTASRPGSAPAVPADPVVEVPLDRSVSLPWPPLGLAVRVEVEPDPAAGAAGSGQIALQLPGAWTPPPIEEATDLRLPGLGADWRTLVLPTSGDVLHVRTPRAGDVLRTAAGTKRLVALFRDAGVPRALRSRWPVVASEAGCVWVPGVAADVAVAARGRASPRAVLGLVVGDARA